jgi:site-specific DNA-cytosine methylase
VTSLPLALDLCCGTGGWTDALLALGYTVVGVDVHRDHRYKGHLVLQDVRTMTGHPFRSFTLIVASPPCTEFTYARFHNNVHGHNPDMSIVDACRRIAAEAGVPLVLENVHGAQRWLGRAAHHFGKFYLWGDGVPALLPAGPRWKDRYKTLHRSAALRGRIPQDLALAIGRYHWPG